MLQAMMVMTCSYPEKTAVMIALHARFVAVRRIFSDAPGAEGRVRIVSFGGIPFRPCASRTPVMGY